MWNFRKRMAKISKNDGAKQRETYYTDSMGESAGLKAFLWNPVITHQVIHQTSLGAIWKT